MTNGDNLLNLNTDYNGATSPIIELLDVHKSYGKLSVLQGLSLQVNRGDVYGFLGRNGAGKSTAIRMMMGITKQDKGDIKLFGQTVDKHVVELRQRVGYVAQEQHFYPWMTAKNLSHFVSGFYPHWSAQRYTHLINVLELPSNRKIGTFSGGMKAKMALAVALATSPECLILDEPTAGMDPIARREFLDLVSTEAKSSETSILFSTHIIDDIEAIANRICIVEAGQALYEGDLQPFAQSIVSCSVSLDSEYQHVPPTTAPRESFNVLQDVQRQGRRTVVLQFFQGVPTPLGLAAEWRRDNMSLEDAFIAVVSRGS